MASFEFWRENVFLYCYVCANFGFTKEIEFFWKWHQKCQINVKIYLLFWAWIPPNILCPLRDILRISLGNKRLEDPSFDFFKLLKLRLPSFTWTKIKMYRRILWQKVSNFMWKYFYITEHRTDYRVRKITLTQYIIFVSGLYKIHSLIPEQFFNTLIICYAFS